MITSDKPIEIPKVWKDLLEIEQLGIDVPKANREGVETEEPKADDPNPYVDDSREVKLKVGNLTVFALLHSGVDYYCLDWEVWEDEDLLFSNEGSDPDFDIPETANFELENGESLAVPVKLV